MKRPDGGGEFEEFTAKEKGDRRKLLGFDFP
jgi:hypothetical protein